MPDFSQFKINRATSQQRALLNRALTKVFVSEKRLIRYLDERLGWDYRLLVDDDDSYSYRVYSLTTELAARGWLEELVMTIATSDEYKRSPHLEDLHDAWQLDPPGETAPAADTASAQNAAKPNGRKAKKDMSEIFAKSLGSSQSAKALERTAELSRSVCLLRSIGGHGGGTGFLVGPDLVLTTAYMMGDIARSGLQAEFSEAANGAPAQILKVDSVVASDPEDLTADYDVLKQSLDFALLRVAGTFDERRVPFDLDRSRQRLSEGEEVILFSYPQLAELKISRGHIVGGKTAPDRMHHSCPTVAGSGGAPVFDTRLRLIGLHEAGHAAHNIAVRADRIALALDEMNVSL